jgi:hypothetical protein
MVDRILASLAEAQASQSLSREHLMQNLSIDRENLETIPFLSRYGGWERRIEFSLARSPRCFTS